MKKIILNILFTIYVVIAVFITLLLLSYNDFKTTEIGGYSLIIVKNNELSPDFNKGDLLVVNNDEKVEIGDKVLYYDSDDKKIITKMGIIEDSEQVTSRDTAYTLDGEIKISGKYIIGPTESVKIIPNAGTILGIVESKWGFLFLIVLPALLLVINQIGVVYSGVKEAKKEELEEKKQQAKEEA